jgi:hypothetical protein
MPYCPGQFLARPGIQVIVADAGRGGTLVGHSLGRRQCRPLEDAAPAAVFDAVEKDALRS